MPCRASAAIVLRVVGATEIVNVLVDRVGVIPQFFVAVAAVEQVAENAFRAVLLFGCAVFGVAEHLLHLFVGFTVDDRLVDILKNQPVLFRIVNAAVVFERLGMRFEIDHIAAVFLPHEDVVMVLDFHLCLFG